ncbi:MAG: GntR family transcriptional regulator [Bryobacteraceae bacterium]
MPETLSGAAYEWIRDKILTGEYPLGSPLSRRRLAEELAMSLVPVAEALQKLEAEGFVESQPRVGTRVKIPTGREVRGRYLVREALESQSARLFAEMAGERERKELRRRALRVDSLAAVLRTRKGDRKASLEFENAHIAFHMKIAECSGCDEIVEAIARSRVLIFNWLFGVSMKMEDVPKRWHQDLVEVLCKGDPLAADEAMRRHVRYRRDEIVARVETFVAEHQSRNKIVRGPQRRTLDLAASLSSGNGQGP